MVLTLIERQGDLFTSSADAYMHGCNTKGKMRAGIAKAFAAYDSEMFHDYKAKCKAGIQPGEGYIFYRPDKPHIINVMTQADRGGARLDYIDSAFRWLATQVPTAEITSIAMPRIAAGLGGLDWSDVKDILISNLRDKPLEVEVWRL